MESGKGVVKFIFIIDAIDEPVNKFCPKNDREVASSKRSSARMMIAQKSARWEWNEAKVRQDRNSERNKAHIPRTRQDIRNESHVPDLKLVLTWMNLKRDRGRLLACLDQSLVRPRLDSKEHWSFHTITTRPKKETCLTLEWWNMHPILTLSWMTCDGRSWL